MSSPADAATPEARKHFIEQIIDRDIQADNVPEGVITRFPPEPNGYLHIGHAKSICLNFGMAAAYGGRCHLRFDDTNPTKEDVEYVESIEADIRWLGFDWGEHRYFTSDYFETLYGYAVQLIERGLAYVDDSSLEEIRQMRGNFETPGTESPHRVRSVAENRDLFARMRAGEFDDGAKVLRAKIDMASPTMQLRDPVLYRILHSHHHHTGDAWCIYPMYDFAHPLSDAIEHISHSLCTLEFEIHRPIYDWLIEHIDVPARPRQYEFARLDLSHTLMSKRRLLELVQDGLVDGWDDPRMPTLRGLRRRGYTPASIRNFCERVGITKVNGRTELSLLEHCVREDLNQVAERRMAVFDPLKVVITNYAEGEEEWLDAVNNPNDESAGRRQVPFSRELWIERSDFLEDAPRKFFRLSVGREVRLRYGFFITCQEAIKNEAGEVVELRCTYDPETRGGQAPDGRKVKGTIHWLSAAHALPAKANLYETLFDCENPSDPEDGKTWREHLNPHSRSSVECLCEPSLAEAEAGSTFQFERIGYFCVDHAQNDDGIPVFNRTVTLKDSWGKQAR